VVNVFDSKKRAAEKQASRDQDNKDLREGKVTPEILRKRNGIFAGFDLTKAVIRFRKR
jgi:hypothetical protein